MLPIQERIQQQLQKREAANSFRKLSVKDGMVDFSSNDYLGLSTNSELLSQIENEFKNIQEIHKTGATGSRLLTGNSAYCESLEKEIAQLFGAASALVFNSGYMANIALLSALPGKGDTILYDELSHACIKDGARLSVAERYSFRHNNVEDLKTKLQKATGQVFVVTESVFSMDGDIAPLAEIATLCTTYNACLIVDEAHATGIYGKNGSGMVSELQLSDKVFAVVNTFGKAVGAHGAAVCTSKTVKKYLINFARPFIYTTALPLHNLATIKTNLNYIASNTEAIQQLKENIAYFNAQKNAILSTENTPIKAVIVPGNSEVKRLSNLLEKKGYDVRPILSPTVKEGSERLRICIHSFNTKNEINTLCNTIATALHN